jgi:hypothetical protein
MRETNHTVRLMIQTAQESLTAKIAVSVTPSEKLKIEFVAGARGTTVSQMLRDLLLPEIQSEHGRITRGIASTVGP